MPRKSRWGYRSIPTKKAGATGSPGKVAWIGSGLTLIGILIPASIAFATWKISDANFRAGVRNNFYARAQSEETFWKGLYDDYLTTFTNELAGQEVWVRARLVAIMDFQRSRRIPTFQEFASDGVPRELIDAEQSRLNTIKDSLCAGLRDRASADPLLQAQFDLRTFECGTREHAAPSTPPASVAQAQAPVAPPLPSTAVGTNVPLDSSLRAPPSNAPIRKSNPSDTGWDLDVFWCRGPAETLNFQRASMLGNELGKLAREGRAIAPGVRMGQVLVRPASTAYQTGSGSPARSSWVVADSGPGEAQAAAAIQGSANSLLGQPLIGLATSNGAPTRWYLSLFICGAPAQR